MKVICEKHHKKFLWVMPPLDYVHIHKKEAAAQGLTRVLMWLRLRVIQINWLYPSGGGWFPQLLTDRASLFALDSPADHTGRRQKELSNTCKINSDYKECGNTKDTVRLITLWHLKFKFFDLKLKLFFVLVSLFYSSQETFIQNWIFENIIKRNLVLFTYVSHRRINSFY